MTLHYMRKAYIKMAIYFINNFNHNYNQNMHINTITNAITCPTQNRISFFNDEVQKYVCCKIYR